MRTTDIFLETVLCVCVYTVRRLLMLLYLVYNRIALIQTLYSVSTALRLSLVFCVNEC